MEDSQQPALDDGRRQELSQAIEDLLAALGEIGDQAREKLGLSRISSAGKVLAGGTNAMVDGSRAEHRLERLEASVRAQLQRLSDEPFVARVTVELDGDANKTETVYVTRASAAGVSLGRGKLATYTAALGRLAELEPGEDLSIPLASGVYNARVITRARLRPAVREDQWDGLEDRIEFSSWSVALESLLIALAHLQPAGEGLDLLALLRRRAAEQSLVRKTLRRRVIDRIALRDQPVLNRQQGDVFRMPLNQQLLLLGPPGTGKTTTLSRRVAQKLNREALTEDEMEVLSRAGLADSFFASDSWAMFAPTELLSLYLRTAFNREGVAAVEGLNLRTWDKERLQLARNVLGVLRSAETGLFLIDDTSHAITDQSSARLSALADEFASYVEDAVLTQTASAIDELEGDQKASVVDAAQRLQRAVGYRGRLQLREVLRLSDAAPELLQPELRRLDEEVRAEVDRIAARLLQKHEGVIQELARELPKLAQGVGSASAGDPDEEEEAAADGDESEEDDAYPQDRDAEVRALQVLLAAIRAAARSTAADQRLGGRAGRVLDFLGLRQPPREELLALGRMLKTRRLLQNVRNAPRRFVMGVPRLYGAFRRKAIAEKRVYGDAAAGLARQRRITPPETDVVILTMLRNARAVLDSVVEPPVWIEPLRARYLHQVVVDEATDFSAVQLACMLELAQPKLRSWFACGDMLQRVTESGIQDVSELAWVAAGGPQIGVHEVRIAYRQARRLRALASGLSGSPEPPSPADAEDADVWPLLAEGLDGWRQVGEWLAGRIIEVERAVGRLPSIAVFVDGEASVTALADAARPFLEQHSVPIVACRDGRDVGDAQEVRVFDVRHIKGLEFEAVFFVGIDELARSMPQVFDRYLYVGITRAATYLGVTCQRELPEELRRLRQFFGDAATTPW